MNRQHTLGLIVFFFIGFSPLFAQQTETLFDSLGSASTVWGLETQISSVKGNAGGTLGGYYGLVFRTTMTVGAAIGFNLTHPEINHGYLGFFAHYADTPHKLIHYYGSLFAGMGVVKDYQKVKSNPFDDFANVFGENFILLQPGVGAELNVGSSFRVFAGIQYRIALGLKGNSIHTPVTEVSSGDFSGFMLAIGTRLGEI